METVLLLGFCAICLLLAAGSYLVLRDRMDVENRLDIFCKR